MVKDWASQFLSSKPTVLEYDLRQAKSMNGSLLFNMLFMWFLHFKMGQTQPLFAQSLSGTLNLIYHPLFQVYILGRNLERPFKTSRSLPGMPPDASSDAKEKAAEADASEEEQESDQDEETDQDDSSDSSEDDVSDDEE